MSSPRSSRPTGNAGRLSTCGSPRRRSCAPRTALASCWNGRPAAGHARDRSRRHPRVTPSALSLPLPTPELVMFDLDYTLLRPSDQFEAPGYVRTGARFGLRLDAGRSPQAERAAYAAVVRFAGLATAGCSMTALPRE